MLYNNICPTADTAPFPMIGLLDSNLFAAPSIALAVFLHFVLPQCKFKYGSSLPQFVIFSLIFSKFGSNHCQVGMSI